MDWNDPDFRRRLRATFEAEAREHLRAIVPDVVLAESAAGAALAEVLGRVLKRLHTLKGAARAVELPEAEQLCHALEGLCAGWQRQHQVGTAEQFDLVHQACATLEQLAHDPAPQFAVQALDLARRIDHTASANAGAAPPPRSVPLPPAGTVSEPAKPAREEEYDPLPTRSLAEAAEQSEAVRVKAHDLDLLRGQVDALLPLELALAHQLGELRELEALAGDPDQVAARARQLAGALHGAHTRLSAVRTRLGEAVLDLAMVSARTALDNLPGAVRNQARMRGKRVAFNMRNDAGRIDRRILDVLREAALHLVTNAIDHGIEQPAARRAAGKAEEGSLEVTVSADDAGWVTLSVADDGAGMDTAALGSAAVRLGVTSAEQFASLDQHQRLHLALEAGVSTMSAVTSSSGRGVGLAIVAERAREVGGELRLHSAPGQGSRFELNVPVRVAAVRALLVRCADAVYAIPLAGLDGVARIGPDALATVEGRLTYAWKEQVLAAFPLGQLLGGGPGEARVAIVARASGLTCAILADDIEGELPLVPRGLGKLLGRPRYYTGAAPLPDGRLVPLLALDQVVADGMGRHATGAVIQAEAERPLGEARRRMLVVEDSVTSRLLLKHIMETAGYDVVTAVDGLDAQSQLRHGRFDAVVTDVEMPRVDGIALTRSIRANPETAELPVVLVTSLQAPEERERGLEAGADAYVVKGAFDQDSLLATLARLM
ncbi:MAG TPA: response regulator [Telluria sp.]|nr:response regulator [Telluria sp.]